MNGTTGYGSELYAYDAWGNIMASYVAPDVKYTYTGQEYDGQTHLYNFRARMYDDTLGRFYATDPAGSTFAPYGYAKQNPMSYVDPTGMRDYYYSPQNAHNREQELVAMTAQIGRSTYPMGGDWVILEYRSPDGDTWSEIHYGILGFGEAYQTYFDYQPWVNSYDIVDDIMGQHHSVDIVGNRWAVRSARQDNDYLRSIVNRFVISQNPSGPLARDIMQIGPFTSDEVINESPMLASTGDVAQYQVLGPGVRSVIKLILGKSFNHNFKEGDQYAKDWHKNKTFENYYGNHPWAKPVYDQNLTPDFDFLNTLPDASGVKPYNIERHYPMLNPYYYRPLSR
jgi:RHS repeat-associated protein